MSQKTDTGIATTIGIDTGKNTLHLIGLDDQGTIALRERLGRGRIRGRFTNVPRSSRFLIGKTIRCPHDNFGRVGPPVVRSLLQRLEKLNAVDAGFRKLKSARSGHTLGGMDF
jgi:hypothetical protein